MALGSLPIAAILQCLGLKLLPGEVMFYTHAQKYTFEDRPERRVCLPHLKQAITIQWKSDLILLNPPNHTSSIPAAGVNFATSL